MNVPGQIVRYDGSRLCIVAPFSEPEFLSQKKVKECTIILEDGRTITALQRRYIYALLRDIADHTGHEPEFLKELFKADVLSKTGGDWFSLSDCSMTQANELIDVLIQFCVEWGVQTRDNIAAYAPNIDKYMYWCLKSKVCCITRRNGAELHYVDRVGMGRDRREISHTGMRAMPLLRQYHDEAHKIGQHTFEEKYHIHGIPLTAELCAVWKLG